MHIVARLSIVVALLSCVPAHAGGAWVPAPGQGFLYLGFSRKTANSSWNASGDSFTHRNSAGQEVWHDFRYAYLSGEIGVVKNLSVTFTGTWLHGLEGPRSAYESNKGLSDAWLGAKYQFAHGRWPMALSFNHRTPALYDLPGPYNRHLFDAQGQFRGVSPEWRGLLKHDYALSWHASRSISRYRGWVSTELGYNWREGAPANQVLGLAEVGYPTPWLRSQVKLALTGQWSVGSDSPRQPDDRFGSRADYNFNKASYTKLGAAWIVPLGAGRRWAAELGFNRWVAGRSARRYNEPYVTLGRSF
jgi:hypothetical protein